MGVGSLAAYAHHSFASLSLPLSLIRVAVVKVGSPLVSGGSHTHDKHPRTLTCVTFAPLLSL